MGWIELNLSTMYADHHVIEVRRILSEIPGVQDVFASGSLRTAQVTFDPAGTNPDQIRAALEQAGYAGDAVFPVETPLSTQKEPVVKPFARHTTVYENVKSVVSFAQSVNHTGRPLWPCPGLGVIRSVIYEEDVGDG